MKKAFFRFLSSALAMFTFMQCFLCVSLAAGSEKLAHLSVAGSEKLGDPIQNMQISANCMQTDSNGNHIFYGLTNDTLFAYNLDTGIVTDRKTVTSANALDIGSDGVLNIAGSRNFYRYNPSTKVLTNVGSISPDTAVMHKGCFDSQGNYYFGTYPNASLFKYDIQAGQLTKIGSNLVAGNYIRATASCGNNIFMGSMGSSENGVNTPAQLKVYNASNGQITEVAPPLWPEKGIVEGEVRQYYSMSSAGKYLFARFSCFTANTSWVMGVYDSEQKQWIDFLLGTSHLHGSDMDENGFVYFRAVGNSGQRTFIAYNPATKQKIDYDGLDFYTGYLINPSVVTLKDQTNYPGKTVVFGASSEGIALFNLGKQQAQFIKEPLPHESFSMRTIHGGYRDEILVSSMASTKFVIYDAAQKKVKKELEMSQKEGINAIDGKYYVGSYGDNASLIEIDPDNWATAKKADMAGHGQNRAFVVEDAEKYILWGTVPDYGTRGGAVGIYNKDAGTSIVKSKFDPIQNQSISGLAYRDGKIYGCTNMFCGLGVEPVVEWARIFRLDAATGNFEGAQFVQLTTDSNRQYFAGGMTFDSQGRLFMACPQTLVEIDPATLQVKRELRLGNLTIPSDSMRWQPFALEWGPNGLLYTNIGGVMSAVDVDAWEAKTLLNQSTAMLTLGTDNNVYYMSDSNYGLSRINLTGTVWCSGQDTAKILDLTVNGIPLKGFSPEQYVYEVECPQGTTAATIEALVNEGAAKTVTQHGNNLPFYTEIQVTAPDGKKQQKYAVYFHGAGASAVSTVTGLAVAGGYNGEETYELEITDSAENALYNVYIYQGEKPSGAPALINCTGKKIDITQAIIGLDGEYIIAVDSIKNGVAVPASVTAKLNTRFGGGSGTQADPYHIFSLRQLQNITNNPTAFYSQQRNIEVALTEPLAGFNGTYNGNGYSVQLDIDAGTQSAGMFQAVSGATIQNVVTKGTVKGGENTGAIAGSASSNASVTGCINRAAVTATGKNAGGIIGSLASGVTVEKCENYGIVTGTWYTGGIAGLQQSLVKQSANYGDIAGQSGTGGIGGYSYASIQECFNAGNIVGTGKYTGGIAGMIRSNSPIAGCYNTGTVQGPDAVAIGRLSNFQGTVLRMENCYNAGKVLSSTSREDMAAVTVDSYASTQSMQLTNCYYISENGFNDGADGTELVSVTGLESAQLGAEFTWNIQKSRFPVLKNILPKENFLFYQLTVQKTGSGTVSAEGLRYLRNGETFVLEITPDTNSMIASVRLNGVDIYTNTLETIRYPIPILTTDSVISVVFAPYDSESQVVSHKKVYREQEMTEKFIVFSTVSEGEWRLERYGVVLSRTQSDPRLEQSGCIECTAKSARNGKGQFGIAFMGNEVRLGGTFYARPYAVYFDSANQMHVLYGETLTVELE